MNRRIFKYYFLLIFFVLLASTLFSAKIAQSFYKQEVTAKLRSIAFALEYHLKELVQVEYEGLAKDYAQKYSQSFSLTEGKLRITFIDFSGRVLGDSEVSFQQMENHLNRKEVQQALASGFGSDIRFSNTIKSDLLYVAVPYSEKQIILRVALPLMELAQINNVVRFYFLLLFFGALLVSLLFSLRISSAITRPLKNIILVSQEIAKGNYKKKINVENSDELGHLAVTFNEMSSQLEATITDLNEKKMEVESILNSMKDGLVAVDKELNIILINPAALNYFNLSQDMDTKGKNIFQFCRHRRINAALQETIETGQSLEFEVKIKSKVFQVTTVPLGAVVSSGTGVPFNSEADERTGNAAGSGNAARTASGCLALIRDITELRKLEKIRRDFVSNVTHELKTPITSIKGFVETLKGGAIADEKVALRFLEIIEIEAERLHNLIEDILRLAEIESLPRETDLQRFRLRDIAEEVLAILQPLAKEKGVSLTYGETEEITMTANRDRIKQLLLNLVDNAIKYNILQGAVTVAAFKEKGKNVISVKDTGIGIPSEHRERIFERFYRVDKGRSREMGGTGLGLSIVKHIVKLYDGDIEVKSEPGRGTEFVVRLPA